MASYIPQLITGLICLLFGGLLTYFIKTIAEKKSVGDVVREAIKDSLDDMSQKIKEAIDTHIKIYHSEKTQTIIDREMIKQTKQFEDRFIERDIRIDEVRRSTSDEIARLREDMGLIKKSVHSIELHFARLSTYFEKDATLKIPAIENIKDVNK